MKNIKLYIPLIAIIIIKHVLSHAYFFIDGVEPYFVFKTYLSVFPLVVMFIMFKYADLFNKMRYNVFSYFLFYGFLLDCSWSALERINTYFKLNLTILQQGFDFTYYMFAVIIMLFIVFQYIYRTSLDFNNIESDKYDKLACYVTARYPRKWYEFLWSLYNGIPVSSFGIVINGKMYRYSKITNKLIQRKFTDMSSYKLKRVSVNKDNLRNRIGTYEKEFNLSTHNCTHFIKDIMGFGVKYYFNK